MHWTPVVRTWSRIMRKFMRIDHFTITTSWKAMGYNHFPFNKYGFMLRCHKPLGPLILTVSCPAPAPRVSQMKRDWNVARTPCSIPGPYTRTLLGSGAPATRNENGLPGTWSPGTTNRSTGKHRSPSKNNDPYIYQSCKKLWQSQLDSSRFLKESKMFILDFVLVMIVPVLYSTYMCCICCNSSAWYWYEYRPHLSFHIYNFVKLRWSNPIICMWFSTLGNLCDKRNYVKHSLTHFIEMDMILD